MTPLDYKTACRQALLKLTAEINAEDWRAAELAAIDVVYFAGMANVTLSWAGTLISPFEKTEGSSGQVTAVDPAPDIT